MGRKPKQETEQIVTETNCNKKVKTIEFSKAIIIFAIVIFALIAVWSMVAYYNMVKLAIETNSNITPDSALPVTCVGTILGAILSYCIYQGTLKSSLNKNGLTVDKITGEVKSVLNCEVVDVISSALKEDDDDCRG